MTTKRFAQIGIDSPLRRLFDYRIPQSLDIEIAPGHRVLVPFGKRTTIGIVVSVSSESMIDESRLKNIKGVLDKKPIFDSESFSLVMWAAHYYQYSAGAALFTALPPALRKIKQSNNTSSEKFIWQIKPDTNIDLKRAPKQLEILAWIKNHSEGVDPALLNKEFPSSHAAISSLAKRGVIQKITIENAPQSHYQATSKLSLTKDQSEASGKISALINKFQVHLLEGVTGSGKTEVYFNLIEQVLSSSNSQVLILVPEIGLTPQLLQRLQTQFDLPIGLLHSNISEKLRKDTWTNIANGNTRIILGTRLAVFTPIPHLKLIVIDEEHDGSFKQQEGFSYHARDVAIYRAKKCNIPIVLGSATPSFESLLNASNNKYQHIKLTKRIYSDVMPRIHVADMRTQQAGSILSTALCQAMNTHLNAGNQVILFLNRRGYAPVLLCHDCGWIAQCERCDANLTYHTYNDQLSCHHCDSSKQKPVHCPTCNQTNLIMVGHGTQRIEEVLSEQFSNYSTIRLDRDITRRKGSLEKILEDIHQQKHQIIIGTQILSKGHDFPNVSLVGVLDIDYGIYSSDFRALERCAQLLVQVSGRSGRREVQGEVYVQTHTPDHALLNTLLNDGYSTFASKAIAARQEWQLPPFTHHVAIRARSQKSSELYEFLSHASKIAKQCFNSNVAIHGPISPAMEKKAGQFRAFILLVSNDRKSISSHLNSCIHNIESSSMSRKVRWSIDVDPMDNF